MRMKGYLNLTEPGIYEFQALSNDGVILKMSGQTVLSDPAQHSDNLSNIGKVTVTTPGWYPITVEYFQRKGTATIKLYWRKPGEEKLKIVPAVAFAHTPDA